ncbi:MAG: 2-hydroxyacid dehydrogenase [Candidatus Heimdallarchaeaceae archaeon]
MKVLIMFNAEENEKKELLSAIDSSASVKFYNDLDDFEKEKALSEAEIIFGGRLTDNQLEKAASLKFHQTFATGVDRHNLSFYKKRGIILCNSHAHSKTIAEYGFALLLAASKELIANDRLLRDGIWNYRQYPSVSLFGKTIVFLGYGKIAQEVKKLCEPFEMKYIAIKRTKECADTSVKVYLPEEKLDALKLGDFIFNALPLTSQTIDFLDEEAFEVLKPDAIVINVGRGKTIKASALYEALKNKKIKGAAIDVWYTYPKNRGTEKQDPMPCYPSEYPFHELDNIIMTAHRAWVTDIPWFSRLKELTDNINRFIRGEQPKNIVNLDLGY